MSTPTDRSAARPRACDGSPSPRVSATSWSGSTSRSTASSPPRSATSSSRRATRRAELLSALAVFGVAFFMRPLGGVILGKVGDRVGRRAALAASIAAHGRVDHARGRAADATSRSGCSRRSCSSLLRCLQGLSAGGEWAGSSSFLVEYAPRNRRGLWGSVVTATAALGSLAGALRRDRAHPLADPGQMEAWGWRIPFLLAAPLAARRPLRAPQARGHAGLPRAAARAPRRARAAARGAEDEPQADRARLLLRRASRASATTTSRPTSSTS